MAETVAMVGRNDASAGKALKLRIITPDRVVVEQYVDEVSAKAIDGELAILPHHEPLITALAIDVIRFRAGREEHSAAVVGGLLEVSEGEVIVLSDTAELDVEIDYAQAKEAKERLVAEATQKTDKLEIYLSEMAISRAMARVKAAELAGRRHKQRSLSE